jgi:hypothetical protein
VRDGHIHRDDIVHAQVKIRHPNRTGLAFHEGRFVRESAAFHIRELEVWYAGERVSRFALTAALSDDPFITFALRAGREGPLEVRLANSRGQRFRAVHEIRFA